MVEHELKPLEPTPKQTAFIHSPAKFTLFGGARGGGKTFAVIIDWLLHSDAYGRRARGVVFRRELTELDDFIEEAKDILEAAGHTWMEQKKQFRSPAGAILRCRYLDKDKDAGKYQGHQYTRVYIEEIGGFPNEGPIKKLAATLRSKYGVPCQFKATANPGGAGHSWVKNRFIDPAAANTPFSTDGGKTYTVYIPAKLTDNPHLMENDPDYIEMIRQSGDDELVRAWLDGDWDVVVGQYFTEFKRQKHVIPTLRLPNTWTVRYRSADWGSAKPFAVYWIAVANGDQLSGCTTYIPRGALVVYRELYGIDRKKDGTFIPNQGVRYTAEQFAEAVLLAEATDHEIVARNPSLNKIDPSTFATNGGPSLAERMARVGCWWTRADNRRVSGQGAFGGWDQVRNRLKGEEKDESGEYTTPMIYFMDCCTHLIRTFPILPRDPLVLDDVDSEAEDHAADGLRYGCMARPYNPPPPRILNHSIPNGVKSLSQFNMNEAWQCTMFGSSSTIPRG